MLKQIDGNDNPIQYVENKAFMISKRLLSSEKLNNLGWFPKYDLNDALKRTLRWYIMNKDQFNPNSKP